MNCKTININNKYEIKIAYSNDTTKTTRLYTMYDLKNDREVCTSFNRDSFLLKANQIVKLGNKIECLIASI